jgi:hypothetical protein
MWYIIMGAVILAQAAVIYFIINRAADIISDYERQIGGNVPVEKKRVTADRKTVESVRRIWEEDAV